MSDSTPASTWHGYVNQLTFDSSFRENVDDGFVQRVVDGLIGHRFFNAPTDDYYQAFRAALLSTERAAFNDKQDEGAVRDMLSRVVAALDSRRPWPERPYVGLDRESWGNVLSAPKIARIPLSERRLEEILHWPFRHVGAGEDWQSILVLTLRSGELVAISADHMGSKNPGAVLMAFSDAESTRRSFSELTGIPTEHDSAANLA